jgi:predicted transcriptional regulator
MFSMKGGDYMTTIFSINAEQDAVKRFRELAVKTGKTQRELFDEAVDFLSREYGVREDVKNG